MKQFTLKYLTENVIPVLRAKHKTTESLTKAIGAFLKQGEEEIPVVNEAGEPVQIEEIILVGAEPADEAPADEEPAELTERSIGSIVEKSVAAAMKSMAASSAKHPQPVSKSKVWAKPALKKSKVFIGPDGDYKAYGFGQFLQYSAFGNKSAKAWLDKEGIECVRNSGKALSEGVASAGGVFVPVEFTTDIIRLIDQFGIFRANANVTPMSSDVQTIPRVISEGAASWYGEGATVAEADDVQDNVELVAKKLGRITRISRELMEDAAISMADRIATSMAQKFAQAEDDAAFNGTGAQSYGGIHGFTEKLKDGNHGAGLISTAADNSFATTIIGTLHEAMGAVHPMALQTGNAKWYISQIGFANCFQRLTAAQGGTNRSEIEGGPSMQFEGSPVVICNSLYNAVAALDLEVAILYGDMSLAATLGDRQQMEITTSEHAYFTTDQIGIRATQRVAINVHDIGDGTNGGPIVGVQFTT